ncbi:unnamed protein product, partial [marine sediment metagenome]
MRFFSKTKDGGPNSPVDAYFLFEIKWLGSVALLKFNEGGRKAYHTHAFHALTWFIKGLMFEEEYGVGYTHYKRSIFPKVTPRSKNHRVVSHGTSWAFTIRGPWHKYWTETTVQTD